MPVVTETAWLRVDNELGAGWSGRRLVEATVGRRWATIRTKANHRRRIPRQLYDRLKAEERG